MVWKKIGKIPDDVAARDRYFGAILEDLSGKFSLLLEGYSALDVRMGKMEERMEKLEERMERLEGRMDRLEVKFDTFCVETNQKFAALFEGKQEFHLRLAAIEKN
jgi:predicted nuclease with TOPRIM domain